MAMNLPGTMNQLCFVVLDSCEGVETAGGFARHSGNALLLGNRFFGPCFLEAEEPGNGGGRTLLTTRQAQGTSTGTPTGRSDPRKATSPRRKM